MNPKRALLSVIALLLASAGSAQYPEPRPAGPFQPFAYGQLRLGVFMPQSSDMDGFGNGVAVGGALGYRFHPNLAGEVDVGYHRSTASASVQGFSADATFSIIPVALCLKAIAPLGAVDLYGVVGVGLHSVTLEASVSGLGSASRSDSAFGFQVGAGLAFPVSPAVSLGADLRYASAKPSIAGSSGTVDGLVITGALQLRF